MKLHGSSSFINLVSFFLILEYQVAGYTLFSETNSPAKIPARQVRLDRIFIASQEESITKHPALRLVPFGLCLSYLAAFQLFKIPPALPVLIDQYQFHRTLAGAFMSVYALNGLFFSFLIGRQIGKSKDRFYILLGLHCMLLGNLISLFRPEAGWYMLVGRSLEGMAYSILAITGPVLANRHTPDGYKPLVVSLTALWIPLGQVAATIIAPFVLEYFSWQGMWWVGIFITLIMIIWTFLIPSLDLQGQTEFYKTGPVDPLNNTQKRLLWLAALVFMLWSTQYFAFMTWLPVYFIEQLSFSLGESLMGYVWPIIIIIIFNLLTGVALRNGIPVGTLLVIGLTTQAAVWWLIPLTQVNVTGILALGFYGMAAGIIATCLFALPGKVTGRSGSAAIAFGFIMTGRNLGVFIGPILLGQWYLFMAGWDHVTPVFAGVTTLAVGAGWLLSRRLSSD